MRAEEYETIILFNKQDRKWEAGTNIPEHQAMFEKRGWRFVRSAGGEKAYEAPKNAITFRDLSKAARPMSEERKAANREHLARMRAAKSAQNLSAAREI